MMGVLTCRTTSDRVGDSSSMASNSALEAGTDNVGYEGNDLVVASAWRRYSEGLQELEIERRRDSEGLQELEIEDDKRRRDLHRLGKPEIEDEGMRQRVQYFRSLERLAYGYAPRHF
jgi:hypothetical protein